MGKQKKKPQNKKLKAQTQQQLSQAGVPVAKAAAGRGNGRVEPPPPRGGAAPPAVSCGGGAGEGSSAAASRPRTSSSVVHLGRLHIGSGGSRESESSSDSDVESSVPQQVNKQHLLQESPAPGSSTMLNEILMEAGYMTPHPASSPGINGCHTTGVVLTSHNGPLTGDNLRLLQTPSMNLMSMSSYQSMLPSGLGGTTLDHQVGTLSLGLVGGGVTTPGLTGMSGLTGISPPLDLDSSLSAAGAGCLGTLGAPLSGTLGGTLGGGTLPGTAGTWAGELMVGAGELMVGGGLGAGELMVGAAQTCPVMPELGESSAPSLSAPSHLVCHVERTGAEMTKSGS